jgi:hypothetical protein
MFPGAHISRNTELPEHDEVPDEEETIAFWKSSSGKLRLAAGTTRRRGEVSVLLTRKEADELKHSGN